MDNLTVTIAAGVGAARIINRKLVYEIACLFSAAHFVMFTLGFLGAENIAPALGKIAPWVAAGALAYIGVSMIAEAYHGHTEVKNLVFSSFKKKLLLSFATSVDAFLVGTSFGFTDSGYWQMALLMVGCVWITSAAGFKLGNIFGRKFGRWVEAAGGITLILLGLKLLLETQGIL